MIHLMWTLPRGPIRALGPAPTLTATKMVRLFTATTLLALLALLSGGLCEEKVFLQRAGTAFNSRSYRSILNVTNGEKFGDWTWPEMCPEGFYAVGFSLRVKTPPGGCVGDEELGGLDRVIVRVLRWSPNSTGWTTPP